MTNPTFRRLEQLLTQLKEQLQQDSSLPIDNKKREIARELAALMSDNNRDLNLSFQDRREREKSLQAIGAAVRAVQVGNEFASGMVQGLLNTVQKR